MAFGHYAEDFIIAHLPALFKNEFNIEVQETKKGNLVGFVDKRFTRVYEITKDKKLIDIAYQLTEKFQKCLDKNIEPELNGCEAECEFLKQEFKGFEIHLSKHLY